MKLIILYLVDFFTQYGQMILRAIKLSLCAYIPFFVICNRIKELLDTKSQPLFYVLGKVSLQASGPSGRSLSPVSVA